MKLLKVGIIGAGGIAANVHIPNYLKNSSRVKVQAIADVNIDRAQEIATQFNIPNVFASYQKMLETTELDAVSVCIPNKFHKDATIAALEAGCHVLCEKPPAMNAEEAELMMETAKKAGKILTYGFHYRYSPEVEITKSFIDAGEMGDIYAARVHAIRKIGRASCRERVK